MIILDTNVLSELTRPAPAARVVAWLELQPAPILYTTTLTQAETLLGLELLPTGKRRAQLEVAVTRMFTSLLADRVLPFDAAAATAYARIAAERRRAGRPIAHVDCQIAAIVAATGATLATHNTADFAGCGVKVVSPWGSA